jgi:branched-chain amino acid transport system ATP-binding protein
VQEAYLGDGGGMMLEVRDLHAYYGKSHILQGVDLSVDQGEIVSLLGRNGVGALDHGARPSWARCRRGQIKFKGRDIAGLRPDQIAHLGIGYVPETATSSPSLTVRQNLDARAEGAGKPALEIRGHVCAVSQPRRAPGHRPACCRAASSRC